MSGLSLYPREDLNAKKNIPYLKFLKFLIVRPLFLGQLCMYIGEKLFLWAHLPCILSRINRLLGKNNSRKVALASALSARWSKSETVYSRVGVHPEDFQAAGTRCGTAGRNALTGQCLLTFGDLYLSNYKLSKSPNFMGNTL